LPSGAEYCPNCGTPVRREPKLQRLPSMSIGKVMQAGILGAFLSVMISSLSPPEVQLYFIPSFVSSVIVIFLFRARRLEEAVITSFSVYQVQLYFIPSFVSSVIVIFLFRARRLEEAVITSFSVYLFADAILSGIVLGTLYAENIPLSEAYTGYMITLLDVVMYVFNPISALIAAYLGNKLMISMGGKTEELITRLKRRRSPAG